MASNVYTVTSLTGGSQGALDSIDGIGLNDGDKCTAYIESENTVYFYNLDASSGAAESPPNIIAPDSNPDAKRWILIAKSILDPGTGSGTDATNILLIELSDTPNSYNNGKLLRSTTSGFEWTEENIPSKIEKTNSFVEVTDSSAQIEMNIDTVTKAIVNENGLSVYGTVYASAYDSLSPLVIKAGGSTVLTSNGISGIVDFPNGITIDGNIVDATSIGITTLLELTDTPSSYVDGKYLRSSGSELIWVDPSDDSSLGILSGNGLPDNDDGFDFELYIDLDTYDIYKKDNPGSSEDDLCTGGSSGSSDIYSGSYPHAYAFDNNTGTRWTSSSASSHWIGYEFAQERTITLVRLYQMGGVLAYSFTVQGTNDTDSSWSSRTWTDIDTVTGIGGEASYAWCEYEIDNSTAYKTVRLYSDDFQNGVQWAVYEIEMKGNPVYTWQLEGNLPDSTSTTLLHLEDTPSSYDDGKVLTSTASGTEWTTPATGGVDATSINFIDLADTPSSYSNGKVLTSTNNGTEWTDSSSGDGADGLGWYAGNGAPSAGLGVRDEHYLDEDTGDIYKKDLLTYSSDKCTGGTPTASGSWGGNVASYAFDNNGTTKWYSAVPGLGAWIGYDFGVGISYILERVNLNQGGGQNATEIRIEGSNSTDADWDSKTWTTLLQTSSVSAGSQDYDFENNTAYRFARIYCVTFGAGGNSWIVSEIEMKDLLSADWQLTGGNLKGADGADSTATALLDLTDTPSSYDTDKYLKSTASGTEWAEVSGGGSGDLLQIPATVSNGEYKGITIERTVAEDVSVGDVLAYEFSSGEYIKADASDSTSIPARVIVTIDATADSQIELLTYGVITNSSWSWSEGDIYVDTTSGALTQTAPTGTGEFVQIVGYALTSTSMFFDPDKTIIELS